MNTQLLENIEKQTQRLMQQLKELEELKDELDKDEYESSKTETLKELEEFERMLKEFQSGDLTLLDKAKKAQINIQDAIKKSFNTQEILKGFSSNEVIAIREKIKTIERNADLNKISKESYIKETLALINQLDGMKAELTEIERSFLDKYTGKDNFVQQNNNQDVKGTSMLKEVKTQLGQSGK